MLTQPGAVIKHGTIAEAILFQSEGYVIISEELYGDSKTTLSFAEPLSTITLIPKYLSDDNFLFLSINNVGRLHIGAYVKGAEKVYGEVQTGELLSTNNLVVMSNGSEFTVTLNNVTVFKFESALFVNGQVRVHGEEAEVFYSCQIEEPQSIAWTANGNVDGVEIKFITIEDIPFMKLTGSGTIKAEMRQSLNLSAGNYTISFSNEGTGRCFVQNGSSVILIDQTITNSTMNRTSLSFNMATDGTAEYHFETLEEWNVGEVQVEPNSFSSPYISNNNDDIPSVRNNSNLTYPIKEEMPLPSGSLYIKISAPADFKEGAVTSNQLIARTDDSQMRLDYGSQSILFTHKGKTLSVPLVLSSEGAAEIVAGWQDNELELIVNGTSSTRIDGLDLLPTITSLIFAEAGSVKEPFILEEWALFPNKINADDIQSELPRALMQSLFEGGISGQNVTWSEIPVAPFDHSPILVQKENGETLRKVSFFDMETGKYKTWNQEPFIYDGKQDFVEVAYSNLNENFRQLSVQTEEGEKIGEPYRIEGKRLYFNLADENKRILKNKSLYATYQVNDTFTIDYNVKAVDGYRIDFSKHNGGQRIVYQEGNRYGESVKLATMIDLNPFQNQNHEGFLYVTNTINQTDSFRITATPDRLHADGASFSTLVIEPLDYQGNFLSHVNLQITANKGFVARHVSKDAIEAQKRSGQYLFQYYAPYIQSETDGELTEDYIWIVDKDSNIGVGYKMILRPVANSIQPPLSRAEKDILTNKTTLLQYILMYEGTEKYEDDALVSILDLNQDGRITTDEVNLLETNEKDGELEFIIKKLRDWEA